MIEKAADEYTNKQWEAEEDENCMDYIGVIAPPAFVAGAEWMLNNQWISVEEALPPYNKSVLVYDEDCDVYFNHRSDREDVKIYDNGFCDLFGKGGEVLYWMPIPKLNKNIKQIK